MIVAAFQVNDIHLDVCLSSRLFGRPIHTAALASVLFVQTSSKTKRGKGNSETGFRRNFDSFGGRLASNPVTSWQTRWPVLVQGTSTVRIGLFDLLP
jgi:hypothetical protein